MPRCTCGGCMAAYEGREDEYLEWRVSGMPCPHFVTRRVRTLTHPIRGVRECANCYAQVEDPNA